MKINELDSLDTNNGNRYLYRVMCEAEYGELLQTGKFKLNDTSLDVKQFGCNLDEAIAFAKEMIKRFDKKNLLIVEVAISERFDKEFDLTEVDSHIFEAGVFTIQEEQLPLFNENYLDLKLVHTELFTS